MRNPVAHITFPSVRHPLKSSVINSKPGVREGVVGLESRNPCGKQQLGCARSTLFARCPGHCGSITMSEESCSKAQDRSPAVGQHPGLGFVRPRFGAPMSPSECLVEMELPMVQG